MAKLKSFFDKRYYKNNKKERLKKHKEYQKANNEKIRKRRRENYDNGYWKSRKDLPNVRFYGIRSHAKRRKIPFNLSFKKFLVLFGKPCVYCGSPNTQGLDRMNNSKGYTIDNVAPCCLICNKAKSIMSVTEYLDHCKKVIKFTGELRS